MQHRGRLLPISVLILATVSIALAERGTAYYGPAGTSSSGDKPSVQHFCGQNDFSFYGDINLPKVLTGFSSSGSAAAGIARDHPASTIALTVVGDAIGANATAEMKDIPMFLIRGSRDQGKRNVEECISLRGSGYRIAVAVNWGDTHMFGESWDLVLPFWQECVRLRYPAGRKPGDPFDNIPLEKGWLCDMETWFSDCPYIAPYGSYEGDKSRASWLPSRYLAYLWRGYVVGTPNNFINPVKITQPNAEAGLGTYPTFDGGSEVRFQILAGKGEDRLDVYWGDVLIQEFKGSAYGVYTGVWKDCEPGLHPIIAVAYKDGKPLATSRPRVVQITGALRPRDPEPDHASYAPGMWSRPMPTLSRPLTVRAAKSNMGLTLAGPAYSLLGRVQGPGTGAAAPAVRGGTVRVLGLTGESPVPAQR